MTNDTNKVFSRSQVLNLGTRGKVSKFLSLFLACVSFADEPSSRSEVLRHEADRLRSATHVSVHEFVGFSGGEHRILSSSDLTVSDVAELTAMLTGPDFLTEPVVEETYPCFVPHHSIVVTRRSGETSLINVCFECHKIYIPSTPGRGDVLNLAEPAQAHLRKLFERLRISVRTSEAYWQLDSPEARPKK